jgi:hypothetical protein
MTFDKIRIYYNAVFGALGGLVSWALVGLVLRFQAQGTFLLFVKDALQGAVVGLLLLLRVVGLAKGTWGQSGG